MTGTESKSPSGASNENPKREVVVFFLAVGAQQEIVSSHTSMLAAVVDAVPLFRRRRARFRHLSAPLPGDVRLDQAGTCATGDARAVRLAVVSMTREPIAFESWLRHHRALGVERFYLFVDATPALETALRRSPWREWVHLHTLPADVPSYTRLIDRQTVLVDAMIGLARADGMTHLAHIDDDELLFCPHGPTPFFRQLAAATVSSIHLHNLEAVYARSECADPFRHVHRFSARPSHFTAYANGKSIGNLADRHLASFGPHFFTGEIAEMPADAGVVLHYESSCVERWQRKFAAYARDSPTACQIPFAFYCASLASTDASVWRAHKVRHDDDGIVEIYV